MTQIKFNHVRIYVLMNFLRWKKCYFWCKNFTIPEHSPQLIFEKTKFRISEHSEDLHWFSTKTRPASNCNIQKVGRFWISLRYAGWFTLEFCNISLHALFGRYMVLKFEKKTNFQLYISYNYISYQIFRYIEV